LRTNQINQENLLTGFAGVLHAARDVLSTPIRWLRVVHLLSSTVICNGMQTAHNRPQVDFQSHTEPDRHLTA